MRVKFCYPSSFTRPKGRDGSDESSGQVDNLTGLRSRYDPLEVCVFAAFAGSFLTFSCALDASLLLLLLFLSAGTFSLAFLHRFCLRVRKTSRWEPGLEPNSRVGPALCRAVHRTGQQARQGKMRSRAHLMITSGCDLDPHRHRFDHDDHRRSSTRAVWPRSP